MLSLLILLLLQALLAQALQVELTGPMILGVIAGVVWAGFQWLGARSLARLDKDVDDATQAATEARAFAAAAVDSLRKEHAAELARLRLDTALLKQRLDLSDTDS